jgi:addiction module RelE/StbE family toxin
MESRFSKSFQKRYRKAPHSIQVAFQKKLQIFHSDLYDPKLRNHKLKGEYSFYRSIDVTGDWRALYRELQEEHSLVAFFDELGTHSQLYKK